MDRRPRCQEFRMTDRKFLLDTGPQTRRTFLKAGALAAAAVLQSVAGPGMAADAEVAVAGGVIDTHTHFSDPTRPQGVPWPGKDDKLLYRRVLPEDYRAVTRGHGITGTIVVEASPWVEDNQWLLELAAREPLIV